MARTKRDRKGKALVAAVAAAVLAVAVAMGSLWLRTYREFQTFQRKEARLEEELAQARQKFERKEAYLTKLLEDEAFLERVARRRLGYARPDELIFRFSEPDE